MTAALALTAVVVVDIVQYDGDDEDGGRGYATASSASERLKFDSW